MESNNSFNEIFQHCIDIANEKYDGHFTLFKFTTNWRFCFGTVGALADLMTEHLVISIMAEGKKPEEAIKKGINKNINAHDLLKIVEQKLEEANKNDTWYVDL